MSTDDLIERGDLDELTIHVDRLCAAGDWDGLVDLRDRCRAALERGRQLWPVAAHAEYRLALEAPGRWAGPMLVPGAGRFALGPLTEVAASTHTWDDLAPHVPAGPPAALAAHERVVRGDDLTGDDRIDPGVLELPLRLEGWEPAYPVAEYQAHEAHFGSVDPPRLEAVDLPRRAVSVADHDVAPALHDLAAVWVTESSGRVETASVEGDVAHALAALGMQSPRLAEVDARHALAVMAWTAASGGAHGRRKGMAAGRFAAWWVLAALAGGLDRWPPPAAVLGEVARSRRWYRWDPGRPDTGWVLRLAVADPDTGRAWAVSAVDTAD